MHRFRKKSDAKRPPEVVISRPHFDEPVLPALPPASDFRTSLILPDLTRRFTLLRSSSGEPFSLDDIRTRFAEQREKGASNHISEEEEDMLVEALSRIRSHSGKGGALSTGGNGTFRSKESTSGGSTSESTSSLGRQSGQSSVSAMSMARESSDGSGSVTGRVSKRHSNNLFAGQFRDFQYMKRPSSKNGSGRSMLSSLSEKSSRSELASLGSSASPRPTTPESTAPSASVDYSPEETNTQLHSIVAQSPTATNGVAALHFARRLSQAQLQRMSASLHGVLQELEEETDDRVLVPRSTVPQRRISEESKDDPVLTSQQKILDKPTMPQAEAVSDYRNWILEEPIGVDPRSTSPNGSLGSASPLPHVPGYIPGMPRPMTPRDMDTEDLRSHSTTPRAASPVSPYEKSMGISPIFNNNYLRRGTSSTARHSPRSGSPLAMYQTQRSDDGRNTPEPKTSAVADARASLDSARNRPASPLSKVAYQPFHNPSRPSTPSNLTWHVNGSQSDQVANQLGRSATIMTHSRQGSSTSMTGLVHDVHNTQGQDTSSLNSRQRNGSEFAMTDGSIKSPTPFVGLPKVAQSESTGILPSFDMDMNSPLSSNGLMSPSTVQSFLQMQTSATFLADEALSGSKDVFSPMLTPDSSGLTQFSTLLLPSASNSSRSSLISGSSYHSWDEEQNGASHILRQSADGDREPSPWHEFPSEASNGRSFAAQDDPEVILRQFTGLTKRDLATIQSMLIEAVHTRARSPEPRSSVMRRRRPSIAHSIQSTGRDSRTTSPAPPPQSPTVPIFNRSSENAAKANALLNSMVNSIPAPDANGESVPIIHIDETQAISPTLSSPSQRTKDLAEALFGNEDGNNRHSPVFTPPADDEENKNQTDLSIPQSSFPEPFEIPDAPVAQDTAESSPTAHFVEQSRVHEMTPSPVLTDPVTPLTPPSRDIMREVQEKTEAAMAQLRKSPSYTKLPAVSHPARRRIQTHDISSPRLVQSSTSIDKIPTLAVLSPPLASPLADKSQSSSKLTSRIKRFRSTLRQKAPTSSGEDVAPWHSERVIPELPRITRNQSGKFSPPESARPIESVRFRPSDHSPPASASPSVKTFLSRFRRRGPSEVHVDQDKWNVSAPTSPMVSVSVNVSSEVSSPVIPIPRPTASSEHTVFNPPVEKSIYPKHSPVSSLQEGTASGSATTVDEPSPDQAALKQFLAAAGQLGLDEAAVNEFLVRSHSKSSRANTVTARTYATRRQENNGSHSSQPSAQQSDQETVQSSDRETIKASNHTKPAEANQFGELLQPPTPIHRVREVSENATNPIVRRTIIFASDDGSNADLATLMQKTSKNKRRTSNTSAFSSRSVHDRAPTPPPTQAKRFSTDSHASPPVPKLPSTFSMQMANTQNPSIGLLDVSTEANPDMTNTYESLYDMYAGDTTTSTFQSSNQNHASSDQIQKGVPSPEAGQAVEVIEMANGETIWSIVNGLRSTDTESLYMGRASMDSEYSAYPPGGDKEQLFFKEHVRASSKGSVNSLLGRKKNQAVINRPETKVFYSSSTQIARLIEQLSRGADSGSFNIKPSIAPGHSHTSSFQSNDSGSHWSVEERLDHMLGFVNNNKTS